MANVEQAFDALGERAKAEQCPGDRRDQGQEHDEFMSEEQPAPNVRDIFLTGSGSRAEHYEIAAYTSLIRIARGVGERECARAAREEPQAREDGAGDPERDRHATRGRRDRAPPDTFVTDVT